MGVLTTGFNAPSVDLLAMLRPTKSTGLYVQIAGRGMRNAPGKQNCIVLDFAGNVDRHGPVDGVDPRKKPGEGDGEAPVKTCPECMSKVPISATECPDCGFEFPRPKPKIKSTASTQAIMTDGLPQWVDVTAVSYFRHSKPGKPPSMRVEYQCGLNFHREWVCLEHSGYPHERAVKWWVRRAPGAAIPWTTADALARAEELRKPTAIAVRWVGKFTEIVGARFDAVAKIRAA
jgi:DNA repair protein RadD